MGYTWRTVRDYAIIPAVENAGLGDCCPASLRQALAIVEIAITPTEITLTRTRKLPEQRTNLPADSPTKQTYRMGGAETTVVDGRQELRGRFLLVSDALVFATSETPRDTGYPIWPLSARNRS